MYLICEDEYMRLKQLNLPNNICDEPETTLPPPPPPPSTLTSWPAAEPIVVPAKDKGSGDTKKKHKQRKRYRPFNVNDWLTVDG